MESQLQPEHPLDRAKILSTLQRLIRAKDFRLARAMANECIEREPQEAEYYRLLFQVEMASGRSAVAQLILEALVKRFNHVSDVTQWYKVLYQLRDDEVILSHFSDKEGKRLKDHQVTQEMMCIVLRSALRIQRLALFEEYLPWLETLRRKSAEYYLLKAIYHLQHHQSQEVLDVVDEGYRLFSNQKDLLLLAGMAHFVQGELEKAQRMFQRAKAQGSVLALSYLLQIETEKNGLPENLSQKVLSGQAE